jgi:mono/diheme cytochrome c family protein
VSRSALLTDAPPQPETTMGLLKRGRERFNIYCTPCHGGAGYGDGMVEQRGYPKPPSLHDDRLRGIADEHLYAVIENGLGKMPSYRAQISLADRWAIVAYVRALQRSQHATIDDIPESERAQLQDDTTAQESKKP